MWKTGRGKLGGLDPLLGTWVAHAGSPIGPVRCERVFQRVLDNAYVCLEARWDVGQTHYEERAMYGVDADKSLAFWSFTSDGKQSRGIAVAAADLPAEAIAFHAEMPAGLARMAYWPAPDGGVVFVVESKNRKGWKRFVEHHYQRVAP